MRNTAERGATVIVRTFRGRPCIRKLWIAGSIGCVVAEDAAYDRMLLGDMAGAVYVPAEDVFRFDAGVAAEMDPTTPFRDWDRLRRFTAPAVGS